MSEVFRVEKTSNYTVMSNYHLRDKRLTLKAKGLLCYILSLPDDWDYTLDGLKAKHPDGKTAIRSCINNLEKAGYLRRRQTVNSNGQFSKNEYFVYEKPISESPSSGFPTTVNPTTDNPSTEKPISENQTQPNTNIQNTNQQNTYSTNYQPTNCGWSGRSKDECIEYLKERFEYEELIYTIDQDDLDEALSIMADAYCSSFPFFKIEGKSIPRESVVARLDEINEFNIAYVYDFLENEGIKPRKRKPYILSMLYCANKKQDKYIEDKLEEMGVI